ncbi:hypothetical protein PSPO01_03258 [Paraphaeosphaeria sporulosa]
MSAISVGDYNCRTVLEGKARKPAGQKFKAQGPEEREGWGQDGGEDGGADAGAVGATGEHKETAEGRSKRGERVVAKHSRRRMIGGGGRSQAKES